VEIINFIECEETKIDKFPYKGKMNKVVGTSIRWLSKHGDDGHGYPEYGLRYFTIQPSGQIPIHNHFYHQTMYILSGQFECWEFDSGTDKLKKKVICGPGTSIYIPSMQPHGMKNIGDEAAAFLCCICNIYDDQDTI
jgi:quercetin dioxygenase-like cupin family protein